MQRLNLIHVLLLLLPVFWAATSAPLAAQTLDAPIPTEAQEVMLSAADLAGVEEPEWEFGFGICTCDRSRGEKDFALGQWQRGEAEGEDEEVVSLAVIVLESVDGAIGRLGGSGRVKSGEGWREYKLGDEAYLVEGGEDGTVSLRLRRGQVVVIVSGKERGVVERFGRLIVAAWPPSNYGLNRTRHQVASYRSRSARAGYAGR